MYRIRTSAASLNKYIKLRLFPVQGGGSIMPNCSKSKKKTLQQTVVINELIMN